MTKPTASAVKYGPWLVALGAALWGTESAWRIPLNDLFAGGDIQERGSGVTDDKGTDVGAE